MTPDPTVPADGPARTPRIGVTTYQEDASWRGWHRRASLTPRDFLDPLVSAGALPLLLPPDGGPAEAADLAGLLDGLLLVGGPDLDPARYGRPREADTTGVQPERDDWELALLAAALDADLPVLGVCRGMQVLNVVRGGTLRQDLADPGHQPAGSTFGVTEVRMAGDLLPGTLLGQAATVACYHHQGVDRLGDGLVATGWSEDGTVESVQLPDRAFAVGIQWHPEVRPEFRSRLFAALVAAARRRAC